jgi:flagellar operon protein
VVNRLDVPYVPPRQETGRPKTAGRTRGKEESFARVLEKTRGRGLTFSAHARQRLQARRINLDAAEINKLAQAVEKVAAKGSRSSLLLYKDLAFVAGVQSRTIITALDGESRKEHIFTNIDSAVIVG